jgi:collagenase-like PrtC family protease
MAVYNENAIHFLKENYPIAKVILSREVTLQEIEKILNTFPDLMFEVFGEGDFCRYNN